MTGPCPCPECVLAGCDRPPVRFAVSRRFGREERELHGKDLADYYRDVDNRKALLQRLMDDVTSGSFSKHTGKP